MIMKKRYFILVLVLILVVAVLFGCLPGNEGGGDSGSGNGDTVSLPPDPGEEGKRTLEGIDSDGDGVRDDVQIAIYHRYPDDEMKRAALTQSTKASQAALIAGNAGDENAAHEAAAMDDKAMDCVDEIIGNFDDDSFLEDKIFNTDDRFEAYLKYNEALSGQIFSMNNFDNPCE
ncbi:MAG: hypothetical protein ABFQ65_03800 [Nanoarchaeota archaeon]